MSDRAVTSTQRRSPQDDLDARGPRGPRPAPPRPAPLGRRLRARPGRRSALAPPCAGSGVRAARARAGVGVFPRAPAPHTHGGWFSRDARGAPPPRRAPHPHHSRRSRRSGSLARPSDVSGASSSSPAPSGAAASPDASSSSASVVDWRDEPAIAPLDLPPSALPRHVAVIMDGNARWARERGLPVSAGHERGVDALRLVVRCCRAWGVPALTVYAFSRENWRRDRAEVDHLMKLLETSLTRELPDLAREGVRVSVMGELGMVTPELRAAIADAVDRTRECSNVSLCVALSYGSRHDVVRAARELVAEAAAGLVDADDVTEETFAARLSSARTRMVTPAGWSRGPVPAEPDLLVRSGGESRLSNFMLWELAYTELLFADAPWPEFGEAEMRDAMATYAKRQRRFGGRGDAGKRGEEEEEKEKEKAEEEGRRGGE